MTGYAKIILAATTSLIVASYSVSMNGIQSRAVQTAVHKVQTVQTEQLQNATLAIALSHIADFGTIAYSNTLTMGTANISYKIGRIDANSAKITVTTTNGDTQTMFARVDNYSQGNYKIHRNGWRVTNKFI